MRSSYTRLAAISAASLKPSAHKCCQHYADEKRGGSMTVTLKDVLVISLEEIYGAEVRILETLPKLATAASSVNLQLAFLEHWQQAERHVGRLNKVCQLVGLVPGGETGAAFECLIEECKDFMEELERGPVRDAALIGAVQKIEHYEIATYAALCSVLKAMGETKVADLMAQTLKEESEVDAVLAQIAEHEVNPDAA